MKTAIISSSLNPESKGFIMCKAVEAELLARGADVLFVDARDYKLGPVFQKNKDNEKLSEQLKDMDNFVFGMAVYDYSVNDNLKMILDTCIDPKLENTLFGVVCAAGGDKSYLSTMHMTQICMNEWRMMQLPRVIYGTGKDFDEKGIHSEDLNDRIVKFADEFYDVGSKLLK